MNMVKRKSVQLAKAALSCVLALTLSVWCVPASAFAAPAGAPLAAGSSEAFMSTQSSGYTVDFQVGPYDSSQTDVIGDDVVLDYFTTLLSADATTNLGLYDESATIPAQTIEYDSNDLLTPIAETGVWLVGYELDQWALLLPIGDDTTVPLLMNLSDNVGSQEFLDGYAEALGGSVTLVGGWKPYRGYKVRFMTRDGGNEAVVTRGEADESGSSDDFLGWDSKVDKPADGEMKDAIQEKDPNSPIAHLFASDDPTLVAERAKIEWYTAPGGPNGGGWKWTGDKLYSTVTNEDMSSAQIVAADRTLRTSEGSIVKLYPYYQADSVAVEYYGNGCDGDSGNAISTYSLTTTVGSTVSVRDKGDLVKNGDKSTFIGWSTDKDASPDAEGILKAGDEIVLAATPNPLKLYAVWQDSYTVKYDTSAGTVKSGSAAEKAITATGTANLLPDVVMDDKVGYTTTGTAGWYVKDAATGKPTGAAVTNDDTFQTLYSRSHDSDGNVTLVYVYEPKQYKVVYGWNGGFAKDTQNAASSYEKADQLWDSAIAEPPASELDKVEKPGYVLDGWTINTGSGDTALAGSKTYGAYSAEAGNASGDASQALTVKAVWTPLGAVVNYIPHAPATASGDVKGKIDPATKNSAGETLVVGGTVTLPASGYSLDGWTLSAWATGTEVDDGEGGYTVTLDSTPVGNTGSPWDVTAEVNNLYTVWTANTYTVKVHGDTEQEITATYDGDAISLTTPTTNKPEGFSFGGWATEQGVHSTSDPKCVQPSEGSVAGGDAKYANLTTEKDATVALYPVWVPDDITTTLSVKDPATGVVTTTQVTHPAGSTDFKLDALDDVPGYVFRGWYSGENGTGDFYGMRAGTSKTDSSEAYDGTLGGGTSAVNGGKTAWPTASTELHAYFTEMGGFSVTFINATLHKGASGPAMTTRLPDLRWTSTVALPAGPAVGAKATDGFTFAGWFKQSDLTSGVPNDGAEPVLVANSDYKTVASKLGLADISASSPVLYAGWTAEPANMKLTNGAFTAANGASRTPSVATAGEGVAAGATEYDIATRIGEKPALPNRFELEGYDFLCWKAGDKYYDEDGAEVDSDGNLTGGAAYTVSSTEVADNTLVAQWKPIAYTVKFQDGAGNVSDTEYAVTYDDGVARTLPAGTLFERSGYAFENWKNMASSGAFAGKEYAALAALPENLRSTPGDVVMQAQWKALVAFTFSPGAATVVVGANLPADVTVESGGTWGASDVPEVPAGLRYDGYKADTWTDGTAEYKNAPSGSYTVDNTLTPKTVVLYPKWEPLPASVRLHYNDGATADKVASVDGNGDALVTGASIALPSAPTRPGFTFMGWSVADDNAIDQLAGDVSATATTYAAPAGNPSHLYAVWVAGGITVTFDGNGATSGSMADQTNLVAGATSGQLSANAFARDGYTFAGWVLDGNKSAKLDGNGCLAEGQAADFDGVSAFSPTAPGPAPESAGETTVKLVAAWQAKTYDITFDANGASVTPSTFKQAVKASDDVALAGPSPAWEREGYTFDGWSKSKSRTAYVEGSDWKDGASYTLDLSGAADANTLYAIWKPKGDVTYTIERYLQNLTGDGWEKAEASAESPVVGERTGTTGQAVSIAGEQVDVYAGFTLDSTVKNQEIDGKSLSTQLSGTVAADGSLVLRAFYTRNAHSIIYKLDPAGQATPDGFILPTGEANVKYGTPDKVVAAAQTAAGWTFSGWTATGVAPVEGKFTMPDNDVVFTGSWTQTTYKVSIPHKGGTYEATVPSGQKMGADDVRAVKELTFDVPEGKYQTGWEKSTDGGQTWETCNDPWDEVIDGPVQFRPAYADTFVVTYRPGIGGNFTDDVHEKLNPSSEENAKKLFPAFDTEKEKDGVPQARAGYTFTGWLVTDADGSAAGEKGKTYSKSDIATKAASAIDGNYTLEAQWTRDAHELKLVFEDCTVDEGITVVSKDAAAPAEDVKLAKGSSNGVTASVGTGLSVSLPSLSKPGYTFAGWTVTTAPTGSFDAPVGAKAVFDMPAGNVTLTAAWTADPAATATITYRSANPDQGTVSVTQQVVDAKTGAVTSATPNTATNRGSAPTAKWGYEFEKWTLVDSDELMASVDETTGAIVPTTPENAEFADRTYVASFAPRSFQVKVNVDDLSSSCKVEVLYENDDWKQTPYLGHLDPGMIVASVKDGGAYKFAGWLYETDTTGNGAYDKKNDASSLIADPADIAIEGPTIFTPHFVPSKTNIVYNLNDPAVKDASKNTTFAEKAEVDASYTVKGIAAVSMTAPAGYTFLGWATSAEGEVAYKAEDIANNSAKIDKVLPAGHTLYAIWQPRVVNITYEPGRHAAEGAAPFVDSDNHAGAKDVAVKTNVQAEIQPAEGYKFVGWLGSDGSMYLDGSQGQLTHIAELPGEGLTLTAQWELDGSYITYDANGGHGRTADQDAITVPSMALLEVMAWSKYTVEHGSSGDLPVFSREGYHFVTWSESADGRGTERKPGRLFTMPASGGVTLFAQWEGDEASVTLHAGEGTFSGDRSDVTYTGVTDQKITASDKPTRDGYAFKGWSRAEGSLVPDEGLADKDPGVELTLARLGGEGTYAADDTLYAVWLQDGAHVVTVSDEPVEGGKVSGAGTYEVAGGEGLPASVVATPDAGYELDGWLVDGELVNETDPTKLTFDKDSTVKPHFSKIPVTTVAVTVTDSGVTGGSVAGKGTYQVQPGGSVPSSVKATPATGYKLDGWLVNGRLNAQTDPSKIAITGATTLKPQFSKLSYPVTVDGSNQVGGVVAGAGSYVVAYGDGVPAAVKATPRTGYKLDGWLVNGRLNAQTDPSKIAITGATTLKPQFSVASHTLETYDGSDRYDTAKRIAQSEAAAADSIKGIIVCSANEGRFPDALSAAGLSGVMGYPVVAVNGEGLTDSDRTALQAMRAKASGPLDILIAGSTAAVSASVESSLSAYGKVSTRFAGSDRYETNRLINEFGAKKNGGWSTDYAFVARGDTFPDALTIAPYLASAKCPIVLVTPSATSLSSSQRATVAGASQAVVLGSSAAVSNAMYSAARAASKSGAATRLGGATRYETSALIVQWELARGMYLEGAGFATGEKFPDALASSWLLGSGKSVLGLVSPGGLSSQMASVLRAAAASQGSPALLRIFGSVAAVPANVRSQIASAASWASYGTSRK